MRENSNVVNNMAIRDGRMADHKTNVSQAAYDNAIKFLKDKKKVDIVRFSHINKQPKATHITQHVTYIDLEGYRVNWQNDKL